MQIFDLKRLLFPSLIVEFFFFFFSKLIELELLIRWTNCVSFMKIRPKMQTLSRKQEMQIEMATFSHTDCPIFLKINRIEAMDEMDKFCEFHENPTKNIDFIA